MIQLTLTEEQAQLVGVACEFYARIRMGQFGEIAFRCAEKHCPKDREAADRAWLELRKHIYPDLNGVGHSYGIGKFEDADRAFDVFQVIRQVMHETPPFSYHELPKCKRVEEQEIKPCPFCGGAAEIRDCGRIRNRKHIPFYKVKCAECGVSRSKFSTTISTAVELWNERLEE